MCICQKISEAQVDIISALHLNHDNKEMLSMFARLFPGKEVREVLASEYGALVCEALHSVIEDEKQTEDQNGKQKRLIFIVSFLKTSRTPSLHQGQ